MKFDTKKAAFTSAAFLFYANLKLVCTYRIEVRFNFGKGLAPFSSFWAIAHQRIHRHTFSRSGQE